MTSSNTGGPIGSFKASTPLLAIGDALVGCRCFDMAEVGEALDMPSDALHGFIRAGVLPVVDIGCRQLVTAGAALAFTPEKRRQEVRARLDDIELRRGEQHGQG